MAKVETKEAKFKPVVITLESQLEVDIISGLLQSVDCGVQKHEADKEKREIIQSIRRELCHTSSPYSGSNALLRGYLTIIPTEID